MTTKSTDDNHNLLSAYSMLLIFAGSMIKSEPPEECIIGLAESGMLKQLPVKSNNPDFLKAAGILRVSCDDRMTCYERLRSDFNQLFTLPHSSLSQPYESLYRDGEGLLFGKSTLAVREIYHRNGWRSTEEGKIPDDHLSTQIQFISLLIEKYMAAEGRDREQLRLEIVSFIKNHPLTWIESWIARIDEVATTDFYKGTSLLIKACLVDLVETLNSGRN